MADMEPATKKQKTEEETAEEPKAQEPAKEEEAAKEEPPAPPVKEEPKELEEDAPADKGARVKEAAGFHTADTTLNVLKSDVGNVLMTLTEGGMQHLLAGARASVGLKGGRYMFEVKVVEQLVTMEAQMGQSRGTPQLIKVGFSAAGSSTLMGEDASVCFDSNGSFTANRMQTMNACQKFGRESTVAVLLNLDEKSANFNTVSLFLEGVRVSKPMALPEALKGKTLFPTVSYKCATVHVNFGPTPLKPLPFSCRMVQDASAKDAVVAKDASPADGACEVILPVGVPDEGAFDWLDAFLAKSPQYTELSDRMVLDWCEKSGLYKKQAFTARSSNDKPEFNFGIRELDDGSVRRALQSVAGAQSRNYVVMELKDNLIKEMRAERLSRFAGFRKVAQVVVGEPTAEFKKKSAELTLKQKQEASDAAFKLKKAEEKRKKLLEKRQKELEKARAKVEKEKAKAAKKAEYEAAKAAYEAAKAAGQEAEEPKEPEEEAEDAEMAEEPEAEDTEEAPKATLTDEEKKQWFRKAAVPDVAPFVVNTSFARFSLPEKAEGFDEVKYEWAKGPKASEHLKTWVLERKLTGRVEDIKPSPWFEGKWKDFQLAVQKWHSKQTEFKASVSKKAAEKAAKVAKKAQAEALKKAKEEAQKLAEEAKAKQREEAKEAGQDVPEEEEKKEEEPAPMEVEEEEKEEEEEVKVDFDGVDVFGVADVTDIGGGIPLFKDFNFEDWTLMSLMFELHLLAHSFKKDVDDAERPGIHVDNLSFYYNRYYRKPLTTQYWGIESWTDLCALVPDVIHVTAQSVMESTLEEEMEAYSVFVKLAEEARRHRALQIDLGNESAKLKLSQQGQFNPHNLGPRPPAEKGFKGAAEKGFKGAGKPGFGPGPPMGGMPYGKGKPMMQMDGPYGKGKPPMQKGFGGKGFPPQGGFQKGGYKGGFKG